MLGGKNLYKNLQPANHEGSHRNKNINPPTDYHPTLWFIQTGDILVSKKDIW